MQTTPLEQELYLVGQVAAIFFENASNFYKVMLIKVKETNVENAEKEMVVTGSFGQIQEAETYRFIGKVVDHPRYGRQFQSERYQQEKPTSAEGVIQYLASAKFEGIGKKTAEQIVTTLGEEAIEVIMQDPEALKRVPQLNAKKREVITTTIRANYGMEQVVLQLNKYGFGNQLAFSIYTTYKAETLEKLEENPYQLVEDVEGIGFKRADALAEQLGIQADSIARLKAAAMHVLLSSCLATGDTYVVAKPLLQETIQLLEASRAVEMDPAKVADAMIQLVEEGKIVQEEQRLYDKSLYFAEWGISSAIERLMSRKKEISYEEAEVDHAIRLLEKKQGIDYGQSQIEAMKAAIRSPLFLLTGGPGTGKTTIINGIVSLFAELNGLSLDPDDYSQAIFPVVLAAPTGRAAKRMNETTGIPASTIHRLLGLTGREKNTSVAAKEIEGGLLIIDEMSMVDTWLANTLMRQIPANMQVIFVGDKDQLPSVGPGQVLHDLLQIDRLPKRELTEIYRQEDGSTIIPLAHAIRQGSLPADFTHNQKDRSFFECAPYQIEPLVRQVVTKAKAKGFAAQDIQVLAPMYRGQAGIDQLNQMMQEIFNPNEDGRRKEVKWNDKVYRIGDKVLQLVNSPEANVYNGDMGLITGITYAKESEEKVDELTIQFDATEVTYARNEWNKITLSYCCSIHKSQGSEFKMVILPLVRQHQRMLQRNLLYTAVTRSRDLLIMVGEEAAFVRSCEHQADNRHTTLIERIQMQLSEETPATVRLQMEAYEAALAEPNEQTTGTAEVVELNKPSVSAGIPTKKTNSVVANEARPEKIDLFETVAKPEGAGSEAKVGAKSKVGTANQADSAEQSTTILTLAQIEREEIDPLIGIGDVSPYDFMTKK